MRFEVCSRARCQFLLLETQPVLSYSMLALLPKALKGEIVRFLLFFCFTMKPLYERAKCRGISLQGVR